MRRRWRDAQDVLSLYAYQMADADFASGALHVRSMAGTAERLFFDHEFRRAFPRWSRDSQSLLYDRTARTQATDRALVRMTVGEGREQVLTTPGAISWLNSDATSDGRSIVATVLAGDHKRTEVVALSETAGRTPNSISASSPAIRPRTSGCSKSRLVIRGSC
jgi:hypothetical protein